MTQENTSEGERSFHNEALWPLARLASLRRLHARAIRKSADIHEGDSVVELGAGYPTHFRTYSKDVGRTGHFYAVDINRAITRRSKNISKILDKLNPLRRIKGREEFVAANAGSLDFKSGSIDVVIASNFTGNTGSAFQEAYRILRPGGRIVTSFTDNVRDLDARNIRREILESVGFIDFKYPKPTFVGSSSIGGVRNVYIVAEKPN